MLEQQRPRRSYAVAEVVGTPVEDRPRRSIGGLRRRADQLRGLSSCFLAFAAGAALTGGAAAFTGEGSVFVPALLSLTAGDIGLGLRGGRKSSRIAAAIALHLAFAACLLCLPAGGWLSGSFLESRRLILGLGGMAFSTAGLWTLLSRPSHRLFEPGPCPVRAEARASRSGYFWVALFALTVFLRVLPWILGPSS